MEVKGETLISLPIFIIKKFGKTAYLRWLKSLSPEAQQIYATPINKSEWFPLNKTLTEPTRQICDMFYKGSLVGAWECGRFSAEYGLKGIYRLLAKLSSPEILITRGAKILHNYYKPSELEIPVHSSDSVIVLITSFPQINNYIEHRIAGWMERAVEISGGKHVNVQIVKSLTKNESATEYRINWR